MTDTITLTSHQEEEVAKALHYLEKNRFATLTGNAGTGKSSCSEYIGNALPGFAQHAAPTGKAMLVLKSKGIENACTIHSLSMRFLGLDDEGKPMFSERDALKTFPDVVVCDESSMIDNKIKRSVEKHGVPVLYVGDPGQLPPVGMKHSPCLEYEGGHLEEIHRQAEGSPIIEKSIAIRNEEYAYDDIEEAATLEHIKAAANDFDIIICGPNKTRHRINEIVRKELGLESKPVPVVGDKIINLANQYKSVGSGDSKQWVVSVANGQIGTIEAIHGERDGKRKDGNGWQTCTIMDIRLDDGRLLERQWAVNDQFGNNPLRTDEVAGRLWDFAYGITCHKSQGSQWDKVLTIADGFFAKDKRWLYTAVTRAADESVILKA